MRILLSLFLMMFSAIGLAETSSVAPKIDENGRLILPNSVPARKLPTEIDPFFKKHKAYEYGATLHIQETDVVADKTKGYTLSSQRAYNEIASVLGHTPRWGYWSDKIKARADAGVGSIEIAGHLTTIGIQVKGDYLGHAAFHTINNSSHENAKKNAFSAILPEIKARNHFINQMENMGNLSPKERAKLVHAYDYFHAQAQPNEYRAPYVFNPDYRKSAIDGEYWGREAKHTVCSRYAYYVSGSHKICRSSPMSFMELAQRGLNRKSNDLANHFDEVWQETNRKARQDLNQMGAAQVPDNLNYAGKASYRANGVFSAAATVPDLAIRVTGADKAAAHFYDKYAPNTAKQIAAEAGQAYTDWASNNPNIAETSKFGLNVATSVVGVKAGLPKKAGMGHDDFAGAVNRKWDFSGGKPTILGNEYSPDIVNNRSKDFYDLYGDANVQRGSLSNKEARIWYRQQEAKIPDLIDKSQSLENQAKQAFNLRNEFRTDARLMMKDRITADRLAREEKNLTWDELVNKTVDKLRRDNQAVTEENIYRSIIDSSQRSRSSVNKALGLE